MIKSQRVTPLVRRPIVLTCIWGGGEPFARLICAVLKHIPVGFMGLFLTELLVLGHVKSSILFVFLSYVPINVKKEDKEYSIFYFIFLSCVRQECAVPFRFTVRLTL